MNSATDNLPHHFAILLERLEHTMDYEKAFHYFLQEFGVDRKFIGLGLVDAAPPLVAVLNQVASAAFGKPTELDQPRISRVAGHGFLHGSAAVNGRAAVFFFFEEANKGLLAIIPGIRGPAEMARFRLPAGLGINPARN